MGFFSHKQQQVKVLLDGEPILRGAKKSAAHHPAGNVTGLTLNEVVALPAKAKLQVQYEGDDQGEGFISFKKIWNNQ